MATWFEKLTGRGSAKQVEPAKERRLPRSVTTITPDNKQNARMNELLVKMAEIREDNSVIQTMLRSYDGAETGRTKSTWGGTQATSNSEIRSALWRLRARSRDLAQNNDWMKKILSLHVNNIVGPKGFTLKVLARDPKTNKLLATENEILKRGFYEWASRYSCDITGRFALPELCRNLIRTVVRDGEGLVRIIRGTKKDVGNKFGIALQVLEVDRLDLNRNNILENGNRVVMGVELDPYGKPVAYYIFKEVESMFQGTAQAGFQSVRVSADEIFHLYIAERPEQQRGVPWVHSCMTTLYHLEQMSEAALVAARVGASRMGFIETPDGNASPMADGMDEVGNLYEDFAPGKIGTLPPGYKYVEGNSKYPDQGYLPFIMQSLRSVASALSIAYHSLGNDLTAVSFSSIRAGTLEERDHWKTVQAWFIDVFLNPLYSMWLEQALLNNALTYTPGGKALDLTHFDIFNCPEWHGRPWDWVDPEKDVNAKILAIKNGLESRTSVLSELGRDINDTWHELAEETEQADALGISVTDTPPAPAPFHSATSAPASAEAPAKTADETEA